MFEEQQELHHNRHEEQRGSVPHERAETDERRVPAGQGGLHRAAERRGGRDRRHCRSLS